ncbi:MAG: methionyl-tRNA formyltransferase [Anaerolineae bacterium]|jgi:methionyl-tRNA formyltransferase|nr:methionyl-tRNA formyltransferase [Anaerolineae bacterium]
MAKIVFMGTPEFALPTLQTLLNYHTVTAVVTQPDRPAGRGSEIRASPIKQLAQQHQIPVFQPEKIRKAEAIEQLRTWEADVFVVAAFGQILPEAVLNLPPHGSINVHASLLPRWRGAAPIQAALRNGDQETGITIMKMDAGLDTGPILTQGIMPIMPDDTGEKLHDKLAHLGAVLLLNTLPGYLSGIIQPRPQDQQFVTHAPRIEKDDGRIDWNLPAVVIDRTVRAFTPWPGTFTTWNGQTLKILSGDAAGGVAQPGEVIHVRGYTAIGTGRGLYLPEMVQLSGKKPTRIDDFLRGHPDLVGARLGH